MLEELPEIFDRVQLRAVGRERQQGEVLGHQQGPGAVPAGLVEDDHGMGLGVDLTGDLGQMQVHGRGVDLRQDQGSGLFGRRANGGEDIGGGIALVLVLPFLLRSP